ncbi:hypothetical protein JHK82_020671 [Glycine max]|nr:hypothetical protein JHK86_020683 [Glycine max]KAG5135940.1 hypothetical protein JHK82_020671 [Glycine max]
MLLFLSLCVLTPDQNLGLGSGMVTFSSFSFVDPFDAVTITASSSFSCSETVKVSWGANPFFLLAGPNVIESEDHIQRMAKNIKTIASENVLDQALVRAKR